jgi:hypothetical protein
LLKRKREKEEEEHDASVVLPTEDFLASLDRVPPPPPKARRIDLVLAQVQQLTIDEIATLPPVLRAQILALCEALKL